MKVSRRLPLTALVASTLLGILAFPVSAADFSLMTGGLITSIEDNNNILAGMNIAIGQDFATIYTFNDTSPNTGDRDGVAYYRFQTAPYGFAPFSVGNLTFESPDTDAKFLIHLLNNVNGLDAYTLLEDEPLITGGNFTNSQIYFNFLDSSQNAFDSIDIPTETIPAPHNFDQRYGHLYFENAFGVAVVRFSATMLQPVPAPSSLIVFAGIVPMLGVLIRRKRKHDTSSNK